MPTRLPIGFLAAALILLATQTTGAEDVGRPRPTERGRQHLVDLLEARLLAGFDPSERAAARTLLTDTIFDWQLRDLATTPYPEDLVAAVQDRLIIEVADRPAAERLAALGEYACGLAAMRDLEAAVLLAVSRYLRDHEDPGPTTAYWTAPARQRYASLSGDEIDREADAVARDLERWAAEAAERYPMCVRQRTQNFLHARTALASARSGSFAISAGSLYQFLLRAGVATTPIATDS